MSEPESPAEAERGGQAARQASLAELERMLRSFDGFDEPGFDDYLDDVCATLGAEPPSRGIWLLEPQPEPAPGPLLIAERIRGLGTPISSKPPVR